ncbi:hypothetical protein FHT44_002844 [Mycolicibacterium sp. BK634]|uniref:hypothetical protein n=1 Tax=Mycolicibacterium sp. BK634 TaxID=2587099 RepID=UPI0016202CBA|nr:hypothetical protein [Mycolicibacterium sp. BK634]MBB3750383.1 hypothetical protein [Mycolicibacterium sp. BK634]
MTNDYEEIDPDPFSLGLAIIAAVTGAASWIETRRANKAEAEEQSRQRRAAWYACVRSVEVLEDAVREFGRQVHVREFGGREFRFGGVRITFPNRQAAQELAELSRRVDASRSDLVSSFDRLSNFLGEEALAQIDELLASTAAALNPLPENYEQVVGAAGRCVINVKRFLAQVGSDNHYDLSSLNL